MVIRLDKDEFNPPADFGMICISSSLKDHRLAHVLNTGLRLELFRDKDMTDDPSDPSAPCYARFTFDDNISNRTVHLIGNRPLVVQEVTRPGDLFGSEETLLLIPELQRVDYVLQLVGNYEPEDLEEMRDVLHGLPGIALAHLTDPTTLRDISPLLL